MVAPNAPTPPDSGDPAVDARSAAAPHQFGAIEWIALASAAIATIAMLLRQWGISSSQIGLTDEGYALQWMRAPDSFEFSLSHFGHFFHPLYVLLHGDIAQLRRAAMLLVFAGATALCAVFIGRLFGADRIPRAARALAAGSIASASLAVLAWNPLMPNYNSLNLMAGLVATTGMLLLHHHADRTRTVAALVCGVGVWMSMMSKPTSSLLLALLVTLHVLAGKRASWRHLLLAVSTTVMLGLASALLIAGSIPKFIERLRTEIYLQSVLEGGHTISDIANAIAHDSIDLSRNDAIALTIVAAGVGIAMLLLASRRPPVRVLSLWMAAAAVATAIRPIGAELNEHRVPMHAALVLLAIPVAVVAASVLLARRNLGDLVEWRHIALAASFVLMPHILSVGTNNNYWLMATWGILFWILAGLVVASMLRTPRHAVAALVVVAVATPLVTSLAMSTRWDRFTDMHSVTRVGEHGTLRIDPRRSAYLTAARELADREGLPAGTRVIDLTGQSPVALLSMDAIPLGRAWIPGGYRGSNRMAQEIFERVDCYDIASAWILRQSRGPRHLKDEVVEPAGIHVRRDFAIVGTIYHPIGRGSTRSVQELRKPVRSPVESRDACKRAQRRYS